jgi:hypothetical protein
LDSRFWCVATSLACRFEGPDPALAPDFNSDPGG